MNAAYRVTLFPDGRAILSTDALLGGEARERLGAAFREWWETDPPRPGVIEGGLIQVDDQRDRPDVIERLTTIEAKLDALAPPAEQPRGPLSADMARPLGCCALRSTANPSVYCVLPSGHERGHQYGTAHL